MLHGQLCFSLASQAQAGCTSAHRPLPQIVTAPPLQSAATWCTEQSWQISELACHIVTVTSSLAPPRARLMAAPASPACWKEPLLTNPEAAAAGGLLKELAPEQTIRAFPEFPHCLPILPPSAACVLKASLAGKHPTSLCHGCTAGCPLCRSCQKRKGCKHGATQCCKHALASWCRNLSLLAARRGHNQPNSSKQ